MPTLDPRATVDAIERLGIVAVIRLKQSEQLLQIVESLAEGGVRAVEITMTVPNAIEAIAQVAAKLPGGFILGAGTVLDAAAANAAIDAGATFIVSPVLRLDIVSVCRERGAAAMPGCFSPTEILTAWDAGAGIVKVFPASALGFTFFKDLQGPLPHVKLMPTGGVTLDNAGDWIRAGAVAVGVGTALLNAQAIATRDYAVLTAHARRIVASVASAREAS